LQDKATPSVRFLIRGTLTCAVKSGQWSKKTREDLRYLLAKHVIPIVGNQPLREVTLTLPQLLLNKMAVHRLLLSVKPAANRRGFCLGVIYGLGTRIQQENPRSLESPS
jgi:hypothetical protein